MKYAQGKNPKSHGHNRKHFKCTVMECTKAHVGLGYCNHHLKQYKKYGFIKTTPSLRDNRKILIEGKIAKVPLGIGAKHGYAIIDASDVELVANYKWSLSSYGYAESHSKSRGGITMHRLLLNLTSEFECDHKNMDRLDNTRENLRKCSRSQNLMNKTKRSDSKSEYKGVQKTMSGKHCAIIKYKGQRYWLGVFDKSKDAALAYNLKALELCGEFARLNKI